MILGAKSLDDLVNRVETINAVTNQNSSIVEQVTTYERSIVHHRDLLHRARASVSRLVLARAAAKRTIDTKLAAAQRLYNSVRAEIAQLERAERAAQLAAQRAAEAAAAAQQTQSQLAGGYLGGGTHAPGKYSGVVGIAMQYLGVPYVWGGASPSGFDCSGLVMYVYAQIGVSLPHYTVSQYSYSNGVHDSRSELQPGDLVFFDGLGHVGLYIGNNEFIHSPHTGDVVKISSISGWYASTYVGARRL